LFALVVWFAGMVALLEEEFKLTFSVTNVEFPTFVLFRDETLTVELLEAGFP